MLSRQTRQQKKDVQCDEDGARCLTGQSLYDAIAKGMVSPTANTDAMFVGPNPIMQAQDLVLLGKEANVQKLLEVAKRSPTYWDVIFGRGASGSAGATDGGASGDRGGRGFAIVLRDCYC